MLKTKMIKTLCEIQDVLLHYFQLVKDIIAYYNFNDFILLFYDGFSSFF